MLLNEHVSPLLGRLYCYLRRNMDIGSCVVGNADKKLISYQAIREHLEYHPPPRSHERPVTVSRDQVKRMLSKLVDIGALKRLQGQRYGVELRFFLPFAVSALDCPQEERHMSATVERHALSTDERHTQSLAVAGFQRYERHGSEGYERHSQSGYERHTSDSITLSLNHTTDYTPDGDDWSWLRYMGIPADGCGRVHVGRETEKFNLRRPGSEFADLGEQRAEWRFWMIRAMEYQEEQVC